MSKNKITLSIDLIEDNKESAELVEKTLSANRYNTVKTYYSAEEYLKKRAGKSDIIIVDYNLGKGVMTGLQLTEKLVKKKLKSKIIFYTTTSNKDVEANALKKGAFEYIVKGEESSLFFLKNAVKHVRKVKRDDEEKKSARVFMIGLGIVLFLIIAAAIIFGVNWGY